MAKPKKRTRYAKALPLVSLTPGQALRHLRELQGFSREGLSQFSGVPWREIVDIECGRFGS